MKRVLFVCIGNSMRSQMAEGLARALAAPGAVDVSSAGTNPTGIVHPAAVRSMKRRGVDIRSQTSKPINVAVATRCDAVISLAGPLDGMCPTPVASRALDWAQPDPTWGGDAEVDRIRDAIEERIRDLFRSWGVLRPEDDRRP